MSILKTLVEQNRKIKQEGKVGSRSHALASERLRGKTCFHAVSGAKWCVKLLLFSFYFLLINKVARATTIDFEDSPLGTSIGRAYAEQGVVFFNAVVASASSFGEPFSAGMQVAQAAADSQFASMQIEFVRPISSLTVLVLYSNPYTMKVAWTRSPPSDGLPHEGSSEDAVEYAGGISDSATGMGSVTDSRLLKVQLPTTVESVMLSLRATSAPLHLAIDNLDSVAEEIPPGQERTPGITVIPEPCSAGLCGFALLGLFVRHWKNRSETAA